MHSRGGDESLSVNSFRDSDPKILLCTSHEAGFRFHKFSQDKPGTAHLDHVQRFVQRESCIGVGCLAFFADQKD